MTECHCGKNGYPLHSTACPVHGNASEYSRGFNDGFAAAVRLSDRSSQGADGYVEDGCGLTKKISIGFPPALFDRINGIAKSDGSSFATVVRRIVDQRLNTHC